MEDWLILVFVCGGVFCFFFIAGVTFCLLDCVKRSREKKLVKSKLHEDQKRRAELAISTLRQLQQSKTQNLEMQSNHYPASRSFPEPPPMMTCSLCPNCFCSPTYPQVFNMVIQPSSHGYSQGNFSVSQVPGKINGQIQPLTSQQYNFPIVSQNYPNHYNNNKQLPPPQRLDRLRLARTIDEIPSSPPPIAAPGFVTAPMVIDHYK